MKAKIHPKYKEATVTCGCGNTFTTMSTKTEIKVEICSACHPFYTGKQKFVDTAGRVQKFEQRFKWDADKAAEEAAKKSAAQKKREKVRKALPKASKKKKAKSVAPITEGDAASAAPAPVEAPELPAAGTPEAAPAAAETPTPTPEASTPAPAEPQEPKAEGDATPESTTDN